MGEIRCDDWQRVKERFEAWWGGGRVGRPMLRIVARRAEPLGEAEAIPPAIDSEDLHLNVRRRIAGIRNHMKTHRYMAEAYPNASLDIGPGSLAVYLGSKPVFAPDTVWYAECADGPKGVNVRLDPEDPWLVRHLGLVRELRAASGGEYLVNVPDIIEGLDIYAAMRGPQNACYDLIDEPEAATEALRGIDEAYFQAYDRFREIAAHEDGLNSFTAFNVLGMGRTAKIQCDFCALMSPKQFRRFTKPALEAQCARLDKSVYHLDGPDAIKHLDALMEIDRLNALQWTCGAGQPDSGSPRWRPIYDRVREAGKSLHLTIGDGAYADWIRVCDELVNRYGADGMYLLLPEMTEDEGERFVRYADEHWSA